MKYIILLAAIFIYCQETSYSQPGKLDSSFGGKGWITEDFVKVNFFYETATQVLTQKNGSYILVIGGLNNGANALAGFRPNGRLDKHFGNDGYIMITDMNIFKIAQQGDGKIIVAGSDYSRDSAILARYNNDGSPDYTFSGDGKLKTGFMITSLFAQDNGKILISYADRDSVFIARYNNDGSPDLTFDEDGIMKYYFTNGLRGISSLDVQKDEKIIVASYFFTRSTCTRCGPNTGTTEPILVRLNSNGTLDQDFGKNGITFTPGGIMELQDDEKIILMRIQNNAVYLTRYNNDGSPDSGFNKDGVQPAEFENGVFPTSIAFQKNGKIVITGSTGGDRPETSLDFALIRYNKNGTLDKSFDGDGKLTTDFGFNDFANSVAIQDNGRIIVAGGTTSINNWDYAIARYKNDGSLDNSFYEEGKKIAYVPVGKGNLTCIAVQNDGKKVVAGITYDSLSRFNFFIARYNPDGSPDKSFSGDGKIVTDFGYSYSLLNTITIQQDGKIVVAGGVIVAQYPDPDKGYMAIARYNIDGTPDSSFGGDGRQVTNLGDNYLSGDIFTLAVQEDGKILAGGAASDNDYRQHILLARYYTDGSLDNSFGKEGIVTMQLAEEYNNASSLVIDQDKKIVVAGGTFVDNNSDFALLRFNDDGTPDGTFGDGAKQITDFEGTNDHGYSLAIQNDGKMVVAGTTAKSYLEYDFCIARYNTDGSLDNTFGNDGKLTIDMGYNDAAHAVNIQEDGKIVLTGLTFNYIDQVANDIAIARCNIDGTLDSSFGIEGKVRRDLGGSERGDGAVIYNSSLYVTGENTIACYDLTGLGNQAPIVKTSIQNNIFEYTSPARIKLKAKATDEDGTITKVQFYRGTTILGTDNKAPYNFVWENVPVGTYKISSKAFDNSSNVTTSNSINISVLSEIVAVTAPVTSTVTAVPVSTKAKADAMLNLNLRPNPTRSILEIHAYGLQQNKLTIISIISEAGTIVRTIQSKNPGGVVRLDLSTLKNGVYTVKLVNGTKVFQRKFVKL